MLLNMFLKVPSLLLIFVFDIAAFDLSDWKEEDSTFLEENNKLENCICVPFWQCKDDFSGLIEDDSDLIDVRFINKEINDTKCSGYYDVCCKIECGRSNRELHFRSLNNPRKNLNFRIFGEDYNDAEFAEFPWMLGILEQRVFRCGGSLIHPQVAMTAAHCVSKNKTYKVRAGEWNWESQDEPYPYQDRWSKKIIVHPEYNYRSLANDIALIILDRPFKIGSNIGTICLPASTSSYNPENCIASGWGKNSVAKGSYQTTLKKVELPIVNSRECIQKLQKTQLGPYFKLHKSFICAGGVANRDTCKGDGGGPLMCPLKENSDRYEQVGIVSWGLTCGLTNTPGVYSNVALLTDWVDSQMMKYNFDTTVYKV